MLTLMDWLVQLEHSRSSLTRTGQERYARMARSKERLNEKAERPAHRPAAKSAAAPVHCCPEATA